MQVAGHRKRHHVLFIFFTHQNKLCFYRNVAGLFKAIRINCSLKEQYLLIDSSFRSLKAVLPHNRTKYLSLPLTHLKKDYKSVETLPEALKYDEYNWEVIKYFKMLAFLMDLQGGFTKFCSYLCLWGSRDTKTYYERWDRPQQTKFIERTNVKWVPLVDPQKVMMPPVHIKLGLMKQFVTCLDKESAAFKYLS